MNEKLLETDPIYDLKYHDNFLEVVSELKLDEIRVIGSVLSLPEQRKLFEDDKPYAVDVRKYSELSGVSISHAYHEILTIAEEHRVKKLSIKLPTGSTVVTSLISSYEVNLEAKTIRIYWNKEFKHLVSGCMTAGKFFLSDSRMCGVSSISRYNFYLLIQKNLYKLDLPKYNNEFYLTKEELREALHVNRGEYKRFCDFMFRLVRPSLKDIKTTIGVDLVARIYKNQVQFRGNYNV